MMSGLASANAGSPSDGVELASVYVGLAAVGMSMILGLVESISLVITCVPFLNIIPEVTWSAGHY